MNWKKTVISALRKGNLDLALKTAVKVDPEELFLLLEDFPDKKDYTPHIAVFLDKIGNLYWDEKMFSPAEEAFRKALEKYQSLTSQDPAYTHEIAAILNHLGTLYGQTGKGSEAEEAFNRALKIRRDLSKENPEANPELALTLNNLGALFLDRGKFFKAKKFFTQALKIRKALAKENPHIYNPDVAMTLNNLGTAYCQLGEFQKAEKAYTESLKIRRILAKENPDYTLYVAMTLNNLGLFYKDTQEFDKAEIMYKEALAIRRDLAKKNPDYIPHVAMTLNNAGLFYRDTQKYSEAENAFTEALQIYRTLAKHLKMYTFQDITTLNNVGSLYRIIGRFYEAENAFTEALKEGRALASENPDYTPLVAMTLTNLGLLYWDTKKFDKAEKAFTEALEKYKILENRNPNTYTHHVAMTLNNVGAVHLDRKEFGKAEKVYQEALEKYRVLANKNQAYIFHVAGILNNLGLLYKDTQRCPEAEKIFTEALDKYKQIASWFYAANTCYNLSQIKSGGELETSRTLLEMAILFSEEKKYAYAQKGEREHIYWGLLEQGMDSFSVLEALRDPELLSLRWEQVVSQEELKKAQKDVEFQKFIVKKVFKRIAPSIQIPVIFPEDILFMYVQKIRDRILFFIVTSDGIKKFEGKREFFITGVKLLYLFRFQLRAVGKPRLMKYVEKFEELAKDWYETLPQGLRELIEGKDHVVFSPDYYCSFFPLEALQMNGESLCMGKTVIRATSLHQFLTFSKKNPSFDSSLVVGNPWPHCSEKKLIYSLPPDSEQIEISFLDGAEEEAKTLRRYFPGSTVLLGEEATGKKFLSEISRHSLIHFCGHGSMGRILFLSGPFQGFPPPFEPEEFSDLRKAERSDKTKKINMMEEWHPVTDLDFFDIKLTEGAVVFLNACETGQHKYAGGGHFQGLAQAFLKKGASHVISSLISLHDTPARDFAVLFYDYLFSQNSVAAALQMTRQKIKEKYNVPLYWLPYIHYGSWPG